jgi:hypothetical protein
MIEEKKTGIKSGVAAHGPVQSLFTPMDHQPMYGFNFFLLMPFLRALCVAVSTF